MREILFRGKPDPKYGTGWCYGSPYTDFEGDCIMATDISRRVVIKDTIGQYTGLTDRNGIKIFEGDIVRYGETIHEIVFETRNGTAYFGLVYSPVETLPFGHYQDLRQIEVIGNIFDNPELIRYK